MVEPVCIHSFNPIYRDHPDPQETMVKMDLRDRQDCRDHL